MLRINNQGKILNKNELKNELGKILPNSDVYILAYVNTGCVIRECKGSYRFPNSPIHIQTLEKAFKYAKDKQRSYDKKNKSCNKKADNVAIQRAIDLLLLTGDYEIFKIERTVRKVQLFKDDES